MKIRVTIDFDVGDFMDNWRDEEIRQNFYDEVVNLIHIKHAEELSELAFKNAQPMMYTLEGFKIQQATKEHHERWSKITYRPDWKFKKL